MSASLPPLCWAGSAPVPLGPAEFLGEGDFCVCYRLGGDHVLRIAKHLEASRALVRERCLLPRLAPHLKTAIPEIVAHGIREDTGEGFVIYPLLPGEPLERARLEALAPAHRESLISQMATFARELHGVSLATLGDCGLEEVDPGKELPALMDRAESALGDLLPGSVIDYHRSLLDEYLRDPAAEAARRSLLHGDLSPGHFLADTETGALTGVIDFGDSVVGPPLRDLIFILEDYGETVLQRFLSHYDLEEAERSTRRVRIFQELDNLDYALARLEHRDEKGLREALGTLAEQARR